MNDQFEFDLRTALRERASLVPTASVSRLTGVEYHPRRSRLRPPVAIGATATAAAAAGAAALIVSLSAGAGNAFAGWTPKPTVPAPGQIGAASAACQASQSPIAGLPLKLADTRGPFTFSIYADSQSSATCIKGPSFTSASGSMASQAVSVPNGQIQLMSSTSERAGQAFSFADGRTGAGVRAVTLTLDDGTSVQATVGNGWYLAWWPSGHAVKSAQVTTPSGLSTQMFHGRGSGVPARAGGSSFSINGGAGNGTSRGETVQSSGVSP